MMCGRSIARLTQEQKDKRDEENQQRYDMVFGQIEAQDRAEWLEEFGESQQFPFKPNGTSIHERAVKRITEQYV